MANTINVNLKLADNGTIKATTKDVELLNAELAQTAAKAKAGSAALASAAKAASGAAAAAAGGVGGSGTGGSGGGGSGGSGRGVYDQARAGAGTGAAGRDFAKQAADIGGLVRVYAVFAANIFAVSTAFTALSKAADTSNMIKGLDQLGAASGKNLSVLSKQLIAASDGALSLKDALNATAQGSAGGLTGDQMLKLTAIAKNASQALGRDLPDALSRLTRGVTKIEPELLDELGILVKVDEASANYARTLGKTQGSLTDLEKRQAFTNAVIAQGEKKFKDISLNANPYQKIIASTSDLANSTLALVNGALSPLVNLLASSPTALATTISGIALLLLKQAIPAVSDFRKGLRQAADDATENAKKISDSFHKFQQDEIEGNKRVLAEKLAMRRADLDSATQTTRDLLKQGVRGGRGAIVEISKKEITNVTPEDLKTIDKVIKSKTTLAAKGGDNTAALNAEVAALSKYRKELDLAKKAELDYATEASRVQTELAKERSKFSEANQRQIIAERAMRNQEKSNILSNVGSNTEVMGISGAWKNLNKDLSNNQSLSQAEGKLGTFGVAATKVQGALTIATSAVSTFLNAFAPWIAIIGLVIAAIGFLDSKLSSNTKELEAFSLTTETLNATTKTLAATLDTINKKPFLEQLSLESIQARTNAMGELNAAINSQVAALIKADKAAGRYDKFIDGWKTIWGGDLRSIATKGISTSISEAISAATAGPEKDKLISELKGIFGDNLDVSSEGLKKALENIPLEKFTEVLQSAGSSLGKFTEAQTKTTNNLVTLSSALAQAQKDADNLLLSLAPSDNISKLGMSVINVSNEIGRVIKTGPINSIIALKELVTDTNKLKLFPPDVIEGIIAIKPTVEKVATSIASSTAALANYKKQLAEIQKLNKDPLNNEKNFSDQESKAKFNENKAKEESLKNAVDYETAQLAKSRSEEESLTNRLTDIQKGTFAYGANLINVALKSAGEAAAVAIQKSAAAGLTGRGAAKAQADIAIKEINVQEAMIKASLALIDAQYLSKLAVDANTNAIEKAILATKIENQRNTMTPAELAAASKQYSALEKQGVILQQVRDAIKGSRGSTGALNKATADLTDPNARAEVQAYSFARAGSAAQLTALEGQKTIVRNEAIIKAEKERVQLAIDQNNKKVESNNLDLQGLETANKYGEIATDTYITIKSQIELSNKRLSTENTLLELNRQLEEQQTRQKQAGVNIAGTQDMIKNIKTQQLLATSELINMETAVTKQLQEQQRIREASLATSETRKLLGTEQITAETASLRDYVQAQQALEDQRSRGTSAINTQYSVTASQPGADQETAAANRDKAIEGLNAQIDLQAKLLANDRQGIAFGEQRAKLLYDQANAMTTLEKATKSMEGVATSLSKAFGKVGTTLGGIVSIVSNSTLKQKKLDQELTNKKLDNAKHYNADSMELAKANTDAELQNSKEKKEAELESYADMAGAAASFFDERSKAAQIFHGIEKAIHIARIAMMGVEIAQDLILTASSTANSGIRAAASGIEAVIKGMSAWPFPLNLAAGAATAAVVAAIIGSGVSYPSGGGGPSAADKQKVAGTGQKYNSSGTLVDTGGGVLGDPTAKSESIAKSIDLLQKYTYDELQYSNKMLNALLAIKNNIGTLSTSIVRATGLTGTFADKSAVESSSRSFLGFSSSTTTLQDSGIQFVSQTIGDIIQEGVKAAKYAITKTDSSSFFGLSKDTSYNRSLSNLDDSIKKNFTDTIKNLTAAVVAAGEALGEDGKKTADKINSIVVDLGEISFKDLKASEIPAYIEAIIGSIGDTITSESLGIVKQYQKIGEGLLETASRVANEINVVTMQFKQAGIELKNIGLNFNGPQTGIGLDYATVKLALVELSGGLEKFVDQSNFYRDNFLTSAEKLAPTQKALTEELNRLGLSSVNTVEQFKNLVQSVGTVGGISNDTYVSLMNISKAFVTVYGTAEDALAMLKKKQDYEKQIAAKLGTAEQQLKAQRKAELETIEESLRPFQEYLYALEDEQTAKDNLRQAYDDQSQSIQDTIDKLKSSSTALKDYRNQLLLSDKSPLTPKQKYDEARAQFDTILSMATAPAATKAEIAAKDDALSKLQGASDSFLSASAIYNASSPQYTADFNKVTTALANASSALDDQATDAQKQLDQMTLQTGKLIDINTSVLSVKDAIAKLAEATLAVAAAKHNAEGGAKTDTLTGLYQNILGRSPDAAGLNYWQNSSLSTGDTRKSFFLSDEFKKNVSSISDLYTKILGRAPDASGLQYWEAQKAGGMSIDNIIKSFVDSPEYKNKYPGLATGGIGLGPTIVGEKGPELVDFGMTGGRVYNNNQSQGMMGNMIQPLLDEISSLRTEVAELRKENAQNANNIVSSNYGANANAAAVVADAVEETARTAAWASKKFVKPT